MPADDQVALSVQFLTEQERLPEGGRYENKNKSENAHREARAKFARSGGRYKTGGIDAI